LESQYAASPFFIFLNIAHPIRLCQKGEVRKEINQGRETQECFRISSFSDAEKFSLWRAFFGKV